MCRDLIVRQAREEELPALSELGTLLWPHHSADSLREEFSVEIRKGTRFFLLFSDTCAVGFAQCGLRRDYVEGTDSSPVAYLEGIFVKEAYRGHGCARLLLDACEAWASEMGCCEFASDCELENEASRLFHLRAGFKEANRIICFSKKLKC